MKNNKLPSRLRIVVLVLVLGLSSFWLLTQSFLFEGSRTVGKSKESGNVVGRCLEELERTHLELTKWMSEMKTSMTVEQLFSRLHYSEDFLLDMRQRHDFGYVAGLNDVKDTLRRLQGTAKGLRLLLRDVRVEYQSAQKVNIVKSPDDCNFSLGNIIHSRIHCRPKRSSLTDIEFYVQEESDMPYT